MGDRLGRAAELEQHGREADLGKGVAGLGGDDRLKLLGGFARLVLRRERAPQAVPRREIARLAGERRVKPGRGPGEIAPGQQQLPEVAVGGDVIGTGTGSAKKHAEQAAAAEAYRAIVATDVANA